MHPERTIAAFAVLGILLIIPAGCSDNNPVGDPFSTPLTIESSSASRDAAHHGLLGYYRCVVDPDIPDLKIIPIRASEFHLNALRFLEPPPPTRITLSNLEISGGRVDVDVQFTHPFGGLPQFSGFDVCGIIITSGSITGFSDPDIVIAGEGDTRLVNADGLTRWWNPREFPPNPNVPMWGYIDGMLGVPDEVAHYTATLNGYKYHADGLGTYEDISALDTSTRGAFSAGAANSRHYTIELDGGLVFNYAIDACWEAPITHPVVVPDSFPLSANRDEPWLIDPHVTENTFYFEPSTGQSGGILRLDVDCYDWADADDLTVRVESPGFFEPVTVDTPLGGTHHYSTYHVDIVDPVLTSTDPVPVWVSAEADMGYDGLLPGKPTAAYVPSFNVDVKTGNIILVWHDEGVIDHENRVGFNDFEPAVITNGDGEVIVSFFWWEENEPGHIWNWVKFARSFDHGHTFQPAEWPQWIRHGTDVVEDKAWNSKLTLGSDGHAFHSYWSPLGHCVQAIPKLSVYEDTCAGMGTLMEHAGEMLYTAEGYPMMFGDLGGTILMRRGDYPNIASTRDPDNHFIGTEYTIVAEALINYISTSRCTGLTSDGRCHLMFEHSGLPYIRMVSSTDISGTAWDAPVNVFDGACEIWVGAGDPGMWIDDNDGFHVLFAGEIWWGEYQLVYGYSSDGTDWSEIESFEYMEAYPVEDGLNDTQVVVFDAFGETYIFLCYETGGNVWCKYKHTLGRSFSDPLQVNEHPNASLPDLYPNGDNGVVFVYQAQDDSGSDLTDIYYRLAEFIVQ